MFKKCQKIFQLFFYRKSTSESSSETLRRNQEKTQQQPMNKYQKIENPPTELPPLPPTANNGSESVRQHGATTNFSKPVSENLQFFEMKNY